MYDWQNVWITIMAGGRGSRFWPWSQPREPKQFLKIPPVSEKQSLLQATIARFSKKVPLERILIVGLAEHEKILRQQLKKLPSQNLILEPFGRNTAASVAMGALVSQRRAKKTPVQLVLAADHHITNVEVLWRTVETGLRYLSVKKSLLTFGIEPRWAKTGYGYIEAAEELLQEGNLSVFRAASFREKPDAATAENYVAAKRFFWNSGMFLWDVETLVAEFNEHLPKTMLSCQTIVKRLAAKRKTKAAEKQPWSIGKRDYQAMEAISVDYGVMERSKRVAVVRTPLQWSDLGGWESLYQLLVKDVNGNVLRCREAKLSNVKNSLIYCNDLQIVADDVEDLVIAYHDGRLLISKRSRAAEIRPLVEALKK